MTISKLCIACNREFGGELSVCPHDGTALIGFTSSFPEADGKFTIELRLGSGSFGEVFKAVDSNGLTVALKILSRDAFRDVEALKRFQREAKAMQHLNHANLPRIYSFGFFVDGAPYIAMEFIDGESLMARLEHRATSRSQLGGRLTAEEALPIFRQASEALDYCHTQGVIHRDLKPDNLLLKKGEDGEQVRIIDFGLARPYGDWALQTAVLTKTGFTVGTPAYMSPEQCMGKKLDRRTDIYSLGCVMFHALTGRLPFFAADGLQVAAKHLSESIVSIEIVALSEATARSLGNVVLKCLQKHPDDRFHDMAELRTALAYIESGAGKCTETSAWCAHLVVSRAAVPALVQGELSEIPQAPLAPGTAGVTSGSEKKARSCHDDYMILRSVLWPAPP